jgi:tRNA (mo5U34)-methyltransferase
MTENLLQRCLDKTWFYPYQLPNGSVAPSSHGHFLDGIHTTRSEMLHRLLDKHFGTENSKLRAIDLACHQGWFSIELAKRHFAEIIATDARETHISDTQLICQTLQLDQVIKPLLSDVHTLNTDALGTFDVVLCLGLIYHLENPIGALRKAHALCKNVCVIETQIAPGQTGKVDYGHHTFVKNIEASFVVVDETEETHGPETSLLGICLVPDLNGLIWILKRVGFKRVELVPVPENAYEQLMHGKRVMLAAYV